MSTFFDAAFLLLGVIVVLLAKFMPAKLFMPNATQWQVTDIPEFLRVNRRMLFSIGLFYIVFVLIAFTLYEIISVDLLKNFIVSVFSILAPLVISLCFCTYRRKYLRLNQ